MTASRTERAERERRAAVAGFWKVVSGGARPTTTDLLELGFPEKTHRSILAAAQEITLRHDAGDHQAARTLAQEAAAALLTDLGPGWSPPNPNEPDLDDLSPLEFAHYCATGRLPGGRTDPDNPLASVNGVRR